MVFYSLQDIYHGALSFEESRRALSGKDPGVFLLRSTPSGHLIFTYRDRGKTKVQDILLPRRNSSFFKDFQGLQQTVLDSTNFIINRFPMLRSPLPPPPGVQHADLRLLEDSINSGTTPGLCQVCNKTFEASDTRCISKKLNDHQANHGLGKCHKCHLLFFKGSLTPHQKKCTGAVAE